MVQYKKCERNKHMLQTMLPPDWHALLADELEKPYFQQLYQFVLEERKNYTIYPPAKDVFSALRTTPYERVGVILLWQDPYQRTNQAHGMCFSVQPGLEPPPSLKNIFKELQADLGCRIPNNGYLVPWAEQGVLLLNTVLTVRRGEANSHKGHGWERFTDAIIRKVSEKDTPVVFVLWGNPAQQKIKLIDTTRHVIVKSAHPSPLSAHHGFFGSRPFSQINKALQEAGKPEINWQIPDL